ncbi:MAG: hypothetical protein IBJ11_07895 [Phycisphaerales bacterium]|nr:hypothetical protein [Phycisphaerales bacterium]
MSRMSDRELWELASLDALGLLDDADRAGYDRAFRAAPPALQLQIRAEQSRFSEGLGLLPDVDPPASLKPRVLAAVRGAIEALAEPVADPADPVIARIMPEPRRPWWNSTAVWRAAAIGMATASIVMTAFFWRMVDENRQITSLIASSALTHDLQKISPSFAELMLSPNRREVALAPAAEDVPSNLSARLFLNTETSKAVLIARNLPTASGTYTLVLEEPDGSRTRVQQFEATGGVVPVEISGLNEAALGRLALLGRDPATGAERVLLRSKLA